MNIAYLPDMSSSQSTKRKRANPSPSMNAPIQLSESGESLEQSAKKPNKEASCSDSAHSVGEHSKVVPHLPTVIANPFIQAECLFLSSSSTNEAFPIGFLLSVQSGTLSEFTLLKN